MNDFAKDRRAATSVAGYQDSVVARFSADFMI
jgi:hypothetical protein